VIEYFKIVDTDFIKNADFFKSIFKLSNDNTICFNSINFYELALFGNTKFYKCLRFKYVTFKGYTHFKSAYFAQGLDLEYANIEKEMSFFDVKGLDSKKSIQNTSQETYRIIKYQLQKVGNIIDSNKYHSLELTKFRTTVKIFSEITQTMDYFDNGEKKSFQYKNDKFNLKNFITKIPLVFHWVASNHSQNWILPLFWIFLVGLLTCLGLLNDESGCINNSLKYMAIINNEGIDIEKEPFIFLLNKILLGYLYYQFLMAIRKDTRK
jgi:hypothetical protein